MTENQLEDERELSAGFRVELEASLNDNRKLREQLSEMSKTYEEKIKELDEMIENVRELHQIKHKQELSIQELEANARQHAIKLENAQKELGTRSNQIEELVKEKNNLLQEV
jgi:3-hydroxyacyl-CoA dehydrogenase